METLSLVIAIIALIIAVLAYQKAGGGMKDFRESTATMLSKFEQVLRKEEKKDSEEKEGSEK